MIRGRRAAIAAALAVVAIAAVTAGCGGGGTSGAVALDPVAAAATKTQNAGAAHVQFAVTLESPQLHGKTVKVNGTGAIDGTSSELTIPLSSLLTGLPSGIDVPTSQLANATMKEVALEQNGDYVLYLNLGSLASQLPGGKQWFELDLSKLGKSAGVDLSKLMSGAQFQPSDLLSMAKAEGAKVDKVGSETVDGVATTHYRVTIDPAKVLKDKGLSGSPLAAAAAQMKSITENVWIDDGGLVRRVQTAYGTAKAHVAMTMDLSDYGSDVTIAAPPSNSVYDATQLVQGLGSFNN